MLFNGKGQHVSDNESAITTPAAFNFAPYTDAITANAGKTTPVYEIIGEDLGTLMYVGGICANGKIYCAPNTADNILVYDTNREYFYTIGSGFGTQAFKYTGFAMWNGKLYAIPRGVNTMLEVDPMTDDVRVIDIGTDYPVTPYGDYRDSHHYNGVISDGGVMYLPPAYSSNKLLKIDMRTFASQEMDFASSDVSTWIGCVKHPTEDKIIFLSTKVFRVWDCKTDTYTDIVDGNSRSCYDMVYDPRYNCFYGAIPNGAFALMLDDYSIISSPYINYSSTGYGISLGIDGDVYHLEGAKAYRWRFDGTAWTLANMSFVNATGDPGDATPYLAGQVVDNHGSIYGVPGSGCMTKLRFDGAMQGLPDSIVTSAYYGKY